MCLKFIPVDKSSLRLAVFCDARFASNKELVSQLKFVVALADANGNPKIIYYSSFKFKEVSITMLAAKLFVANNTIDISSTLLFSLKEKFGC